MLLLPSRLLHHLLRFALSPGRGERKAIGVALSPASAASHTKKKTLYFFSRGPESARFPDTRVPRYPCTRIVPRYYEQTVERTGASVPLVLLAIVFSQCSGGPLFLGLDFIVRLGTLQWSCRLLAVIIRHGRSWFLSANFVFSKTLARYVSGAKAPGTF